MCIFLALVTVIGMEHFQVSNDDAGRVTTIGDWADYKSIFLKSDFM